MQIEEAESSIKETIGEMVSAGVAKSAVEAAINLAAHLMCDNATLRDRLLVLEETIERNKLHHGRTR